jgi:DeoR family glycerol-3-phosphate regulon repressor
VDVEIIGVSSIESDGTLLDHDYREIRVAQAIIAHARETWPVADHSKFSRGAMVRLSQVSRFFTDAPVSGPVQKVLEESRVQLLVAEPEPSGAQGSAAATVRPEEEPK